MKYIIGNFKMNILSFAERERYFGAFKKELKGKRLNDSQLILCPPSIHLESFHKNLKYKSISFGVQNIFWEKAGSYTGEISALMAKSFGAEYVIVGHSERRRYFGETNEIANEKIKSALKSGLNVIYCIGETREERLSGKIKSVIGEQIMVGLVGTSPLNLGRIILAYEPIWSVGTDAIPTSNEILEIRILAKKIIAEKYGSKAMEKMKIVYGGSVKAKTAKQVCFDAEMDGALVGRESLNPREFLKIAEIINN